MRPALPKPARSIIERQHVVLSRCVFAIGLPDNGILPELDDRQIITICLQLVCATAGEKCHARVSDLRHYFRPSLWTIDSIP
jgi:hypothetical protein